MLQHGPHSSDPRGSQENTLLRDTIGELGRVDSFKLVTQLKLME